MTQKMNRRTISGTVAALSLTTSGVASEEKLHASPLIPIRQHERRRKGKMDC